MSKSFLLPLFMLFYQNQPNFEELKPMFIEDTGQFPSYFSTNSELLLIDQANSSYGFLPTLCDVIADTCTYQSNDLEEDLNP